MAKSKSARALAPVSKSVSRKRTVAEAHDQAGKLAADLMDHLATLQLVYCTVDRCEDTDPSEELSAVRNQLGRLLAGINEIHNRADSLSCHLSDLQRATGEKEMVHDYLACDDTQRDYAEKMLAGHADA